MKCLIFNIDIELDSYYCMFLGFTIHYLEMDVFLKLS